MAITNKAIAGQLVKSLRRNRLRDAVNRLALGVVRVCQKPLTNQCCFCGHYVQVGDMYREYHKLKAHATCYKAVTEVLK